MLAITFLKAQNTFTISELQADSATVTIKLEATKVQAQTTEANYTKADSVSASIVRTDTLCSAKDLCVHQDAKVSGNVEVSGKVIAKSGILMDTNAVGIFKRYQEIPIMDSAKSGMTSRVALISAGALSLPSSVNSTTSTPPIDIDPCESGFFSDTVSTNVDFASGFIAGATRFSGTNAVVRSTIKMYTDWWSGSGMIEVGGLTLSSNDGLYLNYHCAKPVYIGWGWGNSFNDWRGMAGSKVYIGDFVRMRKHVEIGDTVWGTQGVNNINLESTNHGNKANIRAKTWTVNTPQFCVFNTNDGSSAPTHGYNGRNTFAVYGDGRVWIRSLETYVPMLSIGQYTSTSSSETNGVEKFRIYSDARTEWVASSGTQNMLTVQDTNNNVRFRVRGDGATSIMMNTQATNKVLNIQTNAVTGGYYDVFNVYGDGRTEINTFLGSKAIRVMGFDPAAHTFTENFRVYGNGKTIIGTQVVVGTHSDALLQVAGKAAAKSFYVLKPTTWADEVFENKTAPDIKEIENFIKKHKHLPEIPSEKDVTENGYDVHEMNRLLLKKIEELYLIVIEQGKEIEKMKKRME
jgi:hypothetical protein